jgi:hypothetical protein
LLRGRESHILRGLFLYGFSRLSPIDTDDLLELDMSSQDPLSDFGGTRDAPYYLRLRPPWPCILGKNIWPKVFIRLVSFAITVVSV